MEFLCIDIMNSSWNDYLGRKTQDRLDNPAWVAELLEKYGCSVEEPFDAEWIAELKELRGRMKETTQKIIDGHGLEKASLEYINDYLSRTSHRYLIEQKETGPVLSSIPLESGKDRILGQIALSFAQLLTGKDLRRIKSCKNPDCRWIFYDESKNRNKCWCESKTCGNLMKVRNFRERKKLQG